MGTPFSRTVNRIAETSVLTFTGLRELRESKLVGEKNQKWSGIPLHNINHNSDFTFTVPYTVR